MCFEVPHYSSFPSLSQIVRLRFLLHTHDHCVFLNTVIVLLTQSVFYTNLEILLSYFLTIFNFISSGALPQLTYNFKVTNVFPTSGALPGGTEVTITGEGFDSENTMASFGDSPCHQISATETELVCKIGHGQRVHKITNKGMHPGKIVTNPCLSLVQSMHPSAIDWANKPLSTR